MSAASKMTENRESAGKSDSDQLYWKEQAKRAWLDELDGNETRSMLEHVLHCIKSGKKLEPRCAAYIQTKCLLPEEDRPEEINKYLENPPEGMDALITILKEHEKVRILAQKLLAAKEQRIQKKQSQKTSKAAKADPKKTDPNMSIESTNSPGFVLGQIRGDLEFDDNYGKVIADIGSIFDNEVGEAEEAMERQRRKLARDPLICAYAATAYWNESLTLNEKDMDSLAQKIQYFQFVNQLGTRCLELQKKLRLTEFDRDHIDLKKIESNGELAEKALPKLKTALADMQPKEAEEEDKEGEGFFGRLFNRKKKP